MIELKFYPEYIGDNEYIELFYKALEPYGVRAKDGLVVWDKVLREEASGLDILQIQWCPERIWRGDDPPEFRHLRGVARLWKYLRLARRLGLRIIWTVHEFVHHDHVRSGFIDRCGYRILACAADLCICHSEFVRQNVIRHYWARPEKVVVMPIGNYDGVYLASGPRQETLGGLGLSEGCRTLICFGMIRPYKGLELALDALRLLGDRYQLIIAGLPLDPVYGEELRFRAANQPNVRFVLERVEKQTLADLIRSADCVLLPYRRITGSAALMTALTLGRAVVASDLPFFRDVLTSEPQAGVLFTPGDPQELARAIEDFFETSTELRHDAARRLADRYDWDQMVQPVVDWLERAFPGKLTDLKVSASHSSGERPL